MYPTAVITNELQRASKIPLLIGADFESGTGMRLDEGTSSLPPWPLPPRAIRNSPIQSARPIALEARAAGVHWIFAPDADVNNNPDNPIINIRSFGEDPQKRFRIRHRNSFAALKKMARSQLPNISPGMAT